MTSKKKDDLLTPLEQRFVSEYLLDFNGTRAYQKVYKTKNKKIAARLSCRKLKEDKLRRAIEKKANDFLKDKDGLTLKARMEIESLAFSDIRDYLEYDKRTNLLKLKDNILNSEEIDTKPISSIEITTDVLPDGTSQQKIKFKLWDKNKAHELLGVHLMLARRHELSGIGGKPIEFSNIDLFKSKVLSRLGEIVSDSEVVEEQNNIIDEDEIINDK